MDDETYVRELVAILALPHGADSGADDADRWPDDVIDRLDGFGGDVRVEAARVVGGEHGVEVEVTFALSQPPAGVSRRGRLRLPVDEGWRELSGYAEPSSYAPEVAREVEKAMRRHIAEHRGRDAQSQRVLPDREEQRRLLLDVLSEHGDVREVEQGRFVVTAEDDALTAVVSPDAWERVLARTGPDAIDEAFTALHGRDDEEIFIVVWRDDLVPSTREELPPVRGRAWERLTAARATGGGQLAVVAYPSGHWPHQGPPAAPK